MSLDLTTLRRTYHELCAQIRADPRTGLPEWTLDLQPGDLLKRPLIFVANDSLEVALEYLDSNANIIGIVSDYRSGTNYGRHRCISTAELVELHRKNPQTILVNSTTAEGAQRHFNRVASQNNISTLSLLQFYRCLGFIDGIRVPVRPNGLLETNDPMAFFKAALDLEAEHSRIEAGLEGLHSKVTRYGLLLQRLTGDSRRHVDVSVGNYMKPFGLDSYVFNKRFFELSDSEVYVDAGAYRGDTLELFANSVHDQFKKIHAFELEPVNFTHLQAFCDGRFGPDQPRVKCHQAGLWDRSERLRIRISDGEGNANTATHIEPAAVDSNLIGLLEVEVVALDDCLTGEGVTLIKLEVEGSEVAALHGARRIIAEDRPKLALSAYHRAHDLIDIFNVVESFDAGYRIDLSHHREGLASFVYYCAPPR